MNVVHEGSAADSGFNCEAPQGFPVGFFEWKINGLVVNARNFPNAMLQSGGRTIRFDQVSTAINSSIVQCVAVGLANTRVDSIAGILLVQGVLGAVTNLSLEAQCPSFSVSWEAPFALSTLHISYCVTIINTYSGHPVASKCGLLETQQDLIAENIHCVDNYTAAVLAVNPAGNGTEAAVFQSGILTTKQHNCKSCFCCLSYRKAVKDPTAGSSNIYCCSTSAGNNDLDYDNRSSSLHIQIPQKERAARS